MKTTRYFNYTRKRQDRAQIKEEWIEFVIENPEKTVNQSDGRIRKWSKIIEARKDPGPEGPALISPRRGGVYLRLRMEYWNGGIMEYWESKADDGLIL